MVINENKSKAGGYVCVIGGTNIDIVGRADQTLLPATSNPGQIKMNLGGVASNISQNLHNLGVKTYLISAIGRDFLGQYILDNTRKMGLDLDYSLMSQTGRTGLYIAILNEGGEMVTGVSHMDVFNEITVEFLKTRKKLLQGARIIVVDTNIGRESIDYIISLATKKGIPLFLDTVSIAKAEKIKDCIGEFYLLKPNILELEFLSNKKIENDKDLLQASQKLIEKGVREVVVSLGEEGAFYCDRETYGKIKGFNREVKNTTGAGDAFLAALVYGSIKNNSLREKTILALAGGALTVSSYQTVNKDLDEEKLLRLASRFESLGLEEDDV